MLGTQLIIQMSDVIVGLFTVMVFLMIDVICSTENDVVMNGVVKIMCFSGMTRLEFQLIRSILADNLK